MKVIHLYVKHFFDELPFIRTHCDQLHHKDYATRQRSQVTCKKCQRKFIKRVDAA